tara:strand:+ start:79 stop:1335 length:1257 start_codon:yes stop_codon:yes gene_type:complete
MATSSYSEKIQNKESNLKVICILCSCIVPLLVTGPFLPDLIVSSLSIWFIYYSINRKIFWIYKNIYFYFFIFFCFVIILSSLLSEDIIFSLKSSLFYFRIGVFALLISYLISQNKKILDYFYYSLLITFTAIVLDGYYQYFNGYNIIGMPIKDFRVSSFFGDELVMGSYLSRLFPLLFALFVVKKSKSKFEIFGISLLFVFVDVLIFISGERTAFALLNLSTVFIIIFISKYKLLRLCVFVISISIISLFTLNDNNLYGRYVESPLQSMGITSIDEKKYFFTQAHDSMIRTSWNMFLDKPILGHGPKFFRIKCSDPKFAEGIKPCDNHPHNFYLQLLAETGSVGFSFLAGLFIYFAYVMVRHLKQYLFNQRVLLNDYQICLYAGLLITIWPLTTNGNIFTNYLMLFYSLQMGFFRKKI